MLSLGETNLVHVKNDVRAANKLSFDEDLWKCRPMAVQKKVSWIRFKTNEEIF